MFDKDYVALNNCLRCSKLNKPLT